MSAVRRQFARAKRKAELLGTSWLPVLVAAISIVGAPPAASTCGPSEVTTIIGTGRIYSPDYPQYYRSNATCTWNLNASSGYNALQLVFNVFDVEYPGDSLAIYDSNGLILYRLTGSRHPLNFLMMSPASVVFSSDKDSVTRQGFDISVNSIASSSGGCGGNLTLGSTVIQTPNYPNAYSGYVSCTWRLDDAAAAFGVAVEIRSFSTLALIDILRFLDKDGRTVLAFWGNVSPNNQTITSVAFITFTTGGSGGYQGFSIVISPLEDPPPPCGGDILMSGMIRSPNYPFSYYNYLNCTWKLQGWPAQYNYRIKFVAFNSEPGKDVMTVYDRSEKTVFSFYGSGLPPAVTVSSPATIVFVSDSTFTYSGFELQVTSTANQPAAQCGGSYSGNGTVNLKSPNFPSTYPNDVNCTWQLRAQSDCSGFEIQFSVLQTESPWDVVQVYNGLSLEGTFSGNIVPSKFRIGPRSRITFTTDATVNNAGFSAVATAFGCGNRRSAYYTASATIDAVDQLASSMNVGSSSVTARSVVECSLRCLEKEATCDSFAYDNETRQCRLFTGQVAPMQAAGRQINVYVP